MAVDEHQPHRVAAARQELPSGLDVNGARATRCQSKPAVCYGRDISVFPVFLSRRREIKLQEPSHCGLANLSQPLRPSPGQPLIFPPVLNQVLILGFLHSRHLFTLYSSLSTLHSPLFTLIAHWPRATCIPYSPAPGAALFRPTRLSCRCTERGQNLGLC